MKKIFLTLSLLVFAFPVLGLVDFHKGGGDKLLTSQTNPPSGTLATSSQIPWEADIDNCADRATETDKVTLDRNIFADLFFRNKEKVVETFKWIVDRSVYKEDKYWFLEFSFSCQGTKTTAIALNFQSVYNLGQWVYDSQYSFKDWNNFITTVARSDYSNTEKKFSQTATDIKRKDKQAFWSNFFRLYLKFLAFSNMEPQEDNTFLTFLDNLKISHLVEIKDRLIALQKGGWLDALPGVSVNAFSDDNLDLTTLLNQDPNTFNPDTLPLEYFKYFKFPSYNRTLVSYRWNNRPHPLNAVHLNLVNKVLDVIKQKDFWTQLHTILSNSWGIKSLFFDGQEYSLKNLFDTLPRGGYNPNWETNFNSLTNAAAIELTKLIFGNGSDTAQGVDSTAKLQQRFTETKTKLLTDLKNALDQLVAFDPTVTQLPLKGQKYDLNQLIAARDKLLEDDFETSQESAFNQVKALFSNQIYASHIIQAINQLTKYRAIKNFLTQMSTDQKLTSLQIQNTNYSFTSLFTDLAKDFADFSSNALVQLQALVDDKIDVNQLDTTYQNTIALIDLWNEIKDELNAYPGAVFNEEIAVSDKGTFTINHLLSEKNDNFIDLSSDARSQLQALLNAKVANGELGTALTTHNNNNNNLNTLWTALKTALASYTGTNPGDRDITISDKPYRLNLLVANKKLATAGSDLTPEQGKDQLQALINNQVTAQDVKTALDAYQESLPSPATETKSPTQESTNQNLAIGLGTTGGVVVLAGAGGFAYWFFKIKK